MPSTGRRSAGALRLYYGMAGWDPQTGLPTAGKMAELRLEEFLDDTAG